MRNVFTKLFIITNFLISNYFLAQGNNFNIGENTISSVQFSDNQSGTYNNPNHSSNSYNHDIISLDHLTCDFPIIFSVSKSLEFYFPKVNELEVSAKYQRVYLKVTFSHKNSNFQNFSFSYEEFMLSKGFTANVVNYAEEIVITSISNFKSYESANFNRLRSSI